MPITPLLALALLAEPQAAARATSPGGGMPIVKLTATGTFSDGATRLFGVTASSSDGELRAMTLAVTCSGGAVSSAKWTDGGISAEDDWEAPVVRMFAPRESGSGLASGKRTHKPVTFRKDLDQRVLATTTYDLKSMTKARTAAPTPTTVSLSNVDAAVCSLH